MGAAQVHFEIYVRERPNAQWTLEVATEDRSVALDMARALVEAKKVLAARVTREVYEESDGEFRSVTILTVGETDPQRSPGGRERTHPVCVTPQDLYTLYARERIGRLLEDWLKRHQATPFELLHRPDLVDRLEASGTALQHAVQKVSLPEAQARGASIHELIRGFHTLTERAIERLMSDHRRGQFPDLDQEGFAPAADRLARHFEGAYLLGGGVAAAMGKAGGWMDKVQILLNLAEAAPDVGPGRTLALGVIEQPLAEILGSRVGLEDILGSDLDLGASLAAMTRLAASGPVERLISVEPSVSVVMPDLSPSARRLAHWLDHDEFTYVRVALGRRILRDLTGNRRLRLSDPKGEIALLRGLAMALTAASGTLLPQHDVEAAFSARSRMLVTGDFVDAYLSREVLAIREAEALVWLTENVIGSGAKRAAGRWLQGIITSLRFEKELRNSTEGPAIRLASLAALQRNVARCGLVQEDYGPLRQKLGVLGGLVEADAKLAASIARAPAPVIHRLNLLLRLACGEAAPLGPAAERARAEILKLVKTDEAREALATAPDRMAAVRDVVLQAGAAA